MDKLRHQIFVSSTFTDLLEERRKVAEALLRIECIPAGMELFPAAAAEQFEFIKTVIDDCDYYIVIVGGRYGSISEEGLSYTELEYRYAVEKGLPVLAFLHAAPGSIAVEKSELDIGLRQKLDAFKHDLQAKRLTATWSSADDLVTKVVLAVIGARKTHPRPGWVRGDQAASVEILGDLAKANRRIGELEALHDAEETLSASDLAFTNMTLTYFLDKTALHFETSLRRIFLVLGGALARPSRWHNIDSVVESIIKKDMGLAGAVSLASADSTRIRSYLFAKELIEIGEDDEEYWTCQITKKGKRVLRELIEREQDDPKAPPPF